ncbi:MAG: ABC transporter permease [Bacteroidales bacterium]|nr:ABC transporter permease [Bacteroidales bacterium]
MFFIKKRPKEIEYSSVNQEVWKRLKRNKMAMFSLFIIGSFSLVAILGYTITPDQTPFANEQHLELTTKKPGFNIDFLRVYEGERKQKKNFFKHLAFGTKNNFSSQPIYKYWTKDDSLFVEFYTGEKINNGEIHSFKTVNQNYEIKNKTFFLGTDRYGRDLLSQLMIGTRVSLSVGFISIIISLIIGLSLGAIAAYFGKWVDNLIMWLINVVWSIPTILLVIAITFALGKGFWQVFVAVGLTMWVDVARVVRGQILSLKEKEFVEAGRALGFKNSRIIIKHILPNVVGAATVITASNFATAILQEAGLSFLGIGVQPPMPSWGTMIKENYGYIILDSPYMAIIPGLAIMLLVLAFILLGSGLRQAMDVKE